MVQRKPLDASDARGAVTGGDGKNPWMAFFGKTRDMDKIDPYSEKDRNTWNLPEAYMGTNKCLKTTMEQLTFTNDSWYTMVAMPLVRSNAISVSWSTYEFNPALADVVPEQGVVRLVSSTRTEGRASFTRRGIGFRLEHGFMNTEKGREHYKRNLEQINNAVMETNNFGVLYAYFAADDYNKQWEKEHGYERGTTAKNILKNDLFFWDILKQQKNAMEILDTYVTDRMTRYHGKADMWIVPPKVTQYITQVPSEKTDYYLAGPKGPKRVNDGVDSFTSFRGNRVYTTRTYDVDSNPVNIMSFPTQIGEYHLAFDRFRSGDYTNYTSKWREIQVFDEDADTWGTLTLLDLVRASQRFHPQTGELLHMDNDEVKRFPTNYDAQDEVKDFMHYVDVNGNLQKADYMGQSYLPVDDLSEIGRTALQSMKELHDRETSVYRRWREGLNALRVIQDYSYDKSVDDFFKALAENSRATEVHPGRVGFIPSVQLEEVKPNAYGGLDIPRGSGGGMLLPPGYDNFPGFKTIAVAATKGKEYVENELGFSYEWFLKVREFVEVIENIVHYLRKFFPNAVAISDKYASSWWHRANAETVFFENIATKHRHPLWLNTGGAGEQGGEQPASLIGDDIGNEPIDVDRVKDMAHTATGLRNHITSKDTFVKLIQDIPFANKIVENSASFEKMVEGAKTLEEVKDAVAAYAVGLALLSTVNIQSKVEKKRKENVEKVTSDLLEKIISVNGSRARLLDTFNQVRTHVLNYVNDNASLFKFTSAVAERVVAVLDTINRELSKFTEQSVRRGERETKHAGYTTVAGRGHFAEDDRLVNAQEIIDDALKSGSYRRAPLTMSVRLFVTRFDWINEGNAASALPSSPLNADRIITFSEYAEAYDKLNIGGKYYSPLDVHATLRPETIRSDMDAFGSATLGAVNNLVAHNERDRMAEEVQEQGSVAAPTLIGEHMPGTFSSTGAAGSKEARRRMELAAARRGGYGRPGQSPLAHFKDVEEYKLGYREKYLGSKGRRGPRSIVADDSLPMDEPVGVPTRAFAQGVYDAFSDVDEHLDRKFGTPTLRDAFFKLDEDVEDDLVRAIGQVYLTTPTNIQNFEAMIRYNIVFPWNFLVLRPHMRYEGLAMIKAKAGVDTGVTWMGNTHFTLGDDAATQMHIGSYTYYSRSVVLNEKNVFIVRNGFIDGYNGGGGTLPYSKDPAQYDPLNSIYGAGSIFSVALPRYETNMPNPLSITGKFTFFDKEIYEMIENDDLHYSTAPFNSRVWGWGSGQLNLASFTYINEETQPNLIVYNGHTNYYDPRTKTHSAVSQGTGHWQPHTTYPGCARVRNGQLSAFKNVDYNIQSQVSFNRIALRSHY